MRSAVLIATPRTPIGRPCRGAVNEPNSRALAGHALIEGRRGGTRFVAVTMCVGGGMGAAGLFAAP